MPKTEEHVGSTYFFLVFCILSSVIMGWWVKCRFIFFVRSLLMMMMMMLMLSHGVTRPYVEESCTLWESWKCNKCWLVCFLSLPSRDACSLWPQYSHWQWPVSVSQQPHSPGYESLLLTSQHLMEPNVVGNRQKNVCSAAWIWRRAWKLFMFELRCSCSDL